MAVDSKKKKNTSSKKKSSTNNKANVKLNDLVKESKNKDTISFNTLHQEVEKKVSKNTAPKKKNNTNNVKKNKIDDKLFKDNKTIPFEEKKVVKDEKIDIEKEIVKNIEKKEEINKEIKVNHNKRRAIFLIILFVLLCFIYLVIPKIYLDGKKVVLLDYNDNYVEPGYSGKVMFFDITNKIKVDNNINPMIIGQYKVNYSYKLGFIPFKKDREVIVVDRKKPIIKVDSDIIKVCPNLDKPVDVNYEAFDEYDGDITNRVVEDYSEGKVILTVSDISNNSTSKEITIQEIDDEKPVITLKGNSTIYLNYGNKYTESGYTANDNCDGDITNKVVVSGNVGTNIGSYKVTYSVTDSSNNKAEVVRTVVIKNNYLYNNGTIGNGVIYLTFDDGPSNGTTNVILDILKQEGVKATFFVTCNGPDSLIKRMYDEGHTVALHTATHNYSYIYSSVDNYFADLNRVSTRVKNITGIESKIIRFPGGSSNTISRNYKYGIMTELTQLVLDKGYRYFDWNVDARDASNARSSTDVYNNVINNLSKSRPNVVLMHDIKGITRDALRNIIRSAKSMGYSFSKIDMNTYMVRHGVNN